MNILTIFLSVVVAATLDSAQMVIGSQCNLQLQATVSEGEQVQFPVYGTELIPEIEIVNRSGIDTLMLKDGRLQMTQSLTLTSFKDSLFFIPGLAFANDGDTFFTEDLSLNVIQPFIIDSADNAITDIKPIYKAGIWWWSIIRAALLWLACVAVVTAIVFLIIWLRRRKKKSEEEPIAPELLRPAEEVALEKLDKIKTDKIWLQGRQKQYHTDLTDVIREYISRRYGISSQEQTSNEVLTQLQPAMKEQKDLFLSLKQMLSLADLVKFAKWNPMPDENEKSLADAYEFVRQTTPTEAEKGEEVLDKQQET